MKLTPDKDYYNLNEIYQDVGIKYATCVVDGDEVIQTGPWIKCRDYLNEYVVAGIFQQESPKVYGYTFNAEKFPVHFEQTRLLVRGEQIQQLVDNIKFLNDVEDSQGWERSTIENIDGTKVYLLRSPGFWQNSTVSISLYSHLIRMLYGYKMDVKDLWEFGKAVSKLSGGNTIDYQRKLEQAGFETFVCSIPEVFPEPVPPRKGMSEYITTENIHNSGGMLSFIHAFNNGDSSVVGLFYAEQLREFSLLTDT